MKTWTLILLSLGCTALAVDTAELIRNREAIERVYYRHRLGEKPPFEQALPRAVLERLVRDDLRKEAALNNTYGVAVTPAMLEAEVRRMDATTRAPEILAELKAALGNDPARFARTVAQPIVVERLLRERFDNDDTLHAGRRREAEQAREQLLAARARWTQASGSAPSTLHPPPNQGPLATAATNDLVTRLLALLRQNHAGAVTEITWKLGARPAKTNAPVADQAEIQDRLRPKTLVASHPRRTDDKDQESYFEEIPRDLQNVLRVQLRQPGDVSAVIEMPGGFLVYVCRHRTSGSLGVDALSLPKRSYEQWIESQEGAHRGTSQ